MRLIDADLLKKNCKCTGEFEDNFKCVSLSELAKVIDEQPTAFDAAEVVQQLEMLIEDKVSESGDNWYTPQCLNEAVGIVKGGETE